jgi:hypothetical protein
MFEFFRELKSGETCGREQYHIFVVILPLVNTKGLGQEVSGDVTFARDVP